MSLCRKELVTCKQCKKEGEFEIWDSINVDIDPQMREKVLSGEIFLYHCPHCGAVTIVPYQTLYHDMERKFMVMSSFVPPEEDDDLTTDIPDWLKSGPREGYRMRFTLGPGEFVEKIKIFENGLDDIAVERLKYFSKNFMIEAIKDVPGGLFFEGVTPESKEREYGTMVLLFMAGGGKEQRFAVDMQLYYEQEMACRFDSRMKAGDGLPRIDGNWMSRKLMEE